MTPLIILLNRGLYGVLAIIAVAVAIPSLAGLLPDEAQPAARQLPEFTLPPLTVHADIEPPARNVFSIDGSPWRGKAVSTAANAPSASHTKGIVSLPGVEGVVTESGFVKPGQMLPEGRLKSIVPGGYVTATPRGDTTTILDAERGARIKALLTPSPQTPSRGNGQ
jgi:hypothetical protein